jgi:hypothetical protein
VVSLVLLGLDFNVVKALDVIVVNKIKKVRNNMDFIC